MRFPFSLSPPWFTCANFFADVPPQSNSPPAFVGYLSCVLNTLDSEKFNYLNISHNNRSKKTFKVGVFQVRFLSSLRCTPKVFSQKQTRVKLNRVFFPRFLFQARSLGCGFARWWVETVRISLIHSCASQLDDEAFGYLKRVIVTPAVYPRLFEFLHVNIQSTGQKSHCVYILTDRHNALF